jgi:hypothetical protein
MSDRVIVRRADDQSLSDLAAALIALADDPHQVVWEHRSGYLTVPEYVAARYADGMDVADETPAETETAPAVAETAAVVVETPVKRKPGRPRKAVAAVIEEEVN